ncbi:MAG: hypothetical protein MUE88_10965 [Flavobacteriales bacterium]|nr:hypothetical protein [Flavobacteriales bacterium]
MFIRSFLALCGASFALTSMAQRTQFWSATTDLRSLQGAERRIIPDEQRTFAVNIAQLQQVLPDRSTGARELELPRPDGTTERFRVWPNVVMHPELAARYPEIRTFAGMSLDRPYVHVRMDLTMHGFHAMVMDDQRPACR